MERATFYNEQALYCDFLLRRSVDAHRRVLIERERQDWLMLARRNGLGCAAERSLDIDDRRRTFAPERGCAVGA